MHERRRFDRDRAFQGGSLSSPRAPGASYCVVRDLSEGGALLLLDEPARAPSEVDLTLARGGGVRRARVVWRGEMGIGVAFAPRGGPGRPSADVVSLDAVRREKARGTDEQRLAERIARVLRPRRGTDVTPHP